MNDNHIHNVIFFIVFFVFCYSLASIFNDLSRIMKKKRIGIKVGDVITKKVTGNDIHEFTLTSVHNGSKIHAYMDNGRLYATANGFDLTKKINPFDWRISLGRG